MKHNTALIFLCSGTTKLTDKKLSHKIALHLVDIGVGEIGTLAALSLQHGNESGHRRKMIFINDCNSSCVKLLTQGFDNTDYLYVDVAAYKRDADFDIYQFSEKEIISKINLVEC
jgi:uncharacterized metal-binding protein